MSQIITSRGFLTPSANHVGARLNVVLRALAIFLAALCPNWLASNFVDAQTSQPVSELDNLLKQIDGSYLKIKTISYSFEYAIHENLPDGKAYDDTMFGVAAKSGKQRMIYFNTRLDILPGQGRASATKRLEYRAVINSSYSAKWEALNLSEADLWDHTSIEGMSPTHVEEMERDTSSDFILHGFGDGRRLLSDTYENDEKKRGRWEAVRQQLPDGSLIFHINRYWPGGTGKPEWLMSQWDIHPDKGFVITGFRSYTPQGDLRAEEKTIPELYEGSDIWLPTVYEETWYGALTHPEATSEKRKQVQRQYHASIKNVILNQPIPESRFSLEALGLSANTDIRREALDGSKSVWRYVSGHLLPRDVALRNAKEIQQYSAAKAGELPPQMAPAPAVLTVNSSESASIWEQWRIPTIIFFGIVAAIACARGVWTTMRSKP